MELDVWLALVALFGIGGLTPGPAVMLVTASSFRYGVGPAMLPALGIATANVIWLLLAASGAAALAAQYPVAFLGLKILGVLVIFYLGITTMLSPVSGLGEDGEVSDIPPRGRLYSKGVALQLSSPLPLVYFGLLLPAYFDPTRSISTQFWIMLVTVTVTELVGLATYAIGARQIRRWLRSEKAARGFSVVIGLVMIASGMWAIISTT